MISKAEVGSSLILSPPPNVELVFKDQTPTATHQGSLAPHLKVCGQVLHFHNVSVSEGQE